MSEICPISPIHSDDSAVGHNADVPLRRFWGPRYWATWVFVAWLRLTAVLPWRWAVKLHKHLGRVSARLQRRRHAIVRRNLETCFPHLTAPQVESLCAQHFENVGAFFAEVAISWFGDLRQFAGCVRIEGREHLDAAVARGKGVLLFSGHFTTLEICVPMVKDLVPLYAFMFRRRSNPLLNEMQRRCRRRAAHASVGSDDVRSLLRMLRRNATVWYAPDQARVDTGVLLPFFGEPAMTSILRPAAWHASAEWLSSRCSFGARRMIRGTCCASTRRSTTFRQRTSSTIPPV